MSRRNRDSYHPGDANLSGRPARKPPPARPVGDGNMYHFGGQSRGRSDFSFRSRISQRDLLTHVPSSIETPVLSQSHASNKFRDIENLTDSDEEVMSEDTDTDTLYNSRAKKRRITADEADTEPKAKWSNPDPYTALPPAPDSTQKKVDVVRLIRKARNDIGAQQSTFAEQDDFISFQSLDPTDRFAPPENAPIGPKAETPLHPKKDQQDSKNVLGKRKHRDFEDDSLMGPVSRTQFHRSGKVLAAWQPTAGFSPTPWLASCESHDSPMTALHKEILDFYEWVKPKDFESTMRRDLVERLAKELKRWRASGKLEAFGSYAAGLYLPTGDMDLVYNYSSGSKFFRPSGRNEVYEVANFLRTCGLARQGSVQPIAKAKVPIVKFIDDLTGLKVDLSFNNNTGIVANETFKTWQVTYPAVPIIVAVVKQFLMIRGLNDNSVGGLGGFATICMVTSLIQNLPAQKNQNLGELLIEFFNLYGNLLNVQNVGIRMEPPGYINKKTHHQMRDEKPDRLVIIDPNKADNNITGGSTEYIRISNLFSRTHTIVSSRLDDFAQRDKQDHSFSFLADLIGGDFSAYNSQRVALSKIYQRSQNGTVTEEPPQPPNASKSEARLTRLRLLFPELAEKLAERTSIGPNEAVTIGGWTSKGAMYRDISARELRPAGKGKKA